MASSSRPQPPDEGKFVTEGRYALKLKSATVLLEFGHSARWTGTIIGRKSDKTLVLTVAHVVATAKWMSEEEKESLLGAYFYDKQQTKCSCKIAIYDEQCNILLLVVNKSSTPFHKLSFAPENERGLKELQLLGCRGHPQGHLWRIAMGKICSPLLKNNETGAFPGFDSQTSYFEHRLDLASGYDGAALVNESGNIVGMQTLYPAHSFRSSEVMSAEPIKDAITAKKKNLEEAKTRAEQPAELQQLESQLQNLSISPSDIHYKDIHYKEVHALSIHIPKSEIKFAIHVQFLHDVLQYYLKKDAGGSTGQSLDKALENHYIR